MSVIRQSDAFGRHTRRRLVGVGAAVCAATLETLAVGVWFLLVVDGSRSVSTALAGLGVLFCGALLRMGVYGLTTTAIDDILTPVRIGATLTLVTGWLVWLLAAELTGGVFGLIVAGTLLATILTIQFLLERRVFRLTDTQRGQFTALLAAGLIAIGATILLASAWFSDWSVLSESFSLGDRTLVIQVEAIQVGLLVFGVFVFLAHQRRFQQTLEP
ncbi:hypothetical protein ACLI4U_03675 [Natrialbaceae archaeon A-CW2]|uniref:hypothetical protein n=1 Tax=Natronosalvus amylolyticus TaxID=2961994 RepID=UPI0020C9B8CF|nr:hypothetical protein [Natronosalvus amylolyticus]